MFVSETAISWFKLYRIFDVSRDSVKTCQKCSRMLEERSQFTEFTRTSVSLILIAGGSHHELRFQSTGNSFFRQVDLYSQQKQGQLDKLLKNVHTFVLYMDQMIKTLNIVGDMQYIKYYIIHTHSKSLNAQKYKPTIDCISFSSRPCGQWQLHFWGVVIHACQ